MTASATQRDNPAAMSRVRQMIVASAYTAYSAVSRHQFLQRFVAG